MIAQKKYRSHIKEEVSVMINFLYNQYLNNFLVQINTINYFSDRSSEYVRYESAAKKRIIKQLKKVRA